MTHDSPASKGSMSTRLTVFLDPYGKFLLSGGRGAYPVEVELAEGYRVVEDAGGKRSLVGPDGSWTELTPAFHAGVARFV